MHGARPGRIVRAGRAPRLNLEESILLVIADGKGHPAYGGVSGAHCAAKADKDAKDPPC
jgi:hypothetical protein